MLQPTSCRGFSLIEVCIVIFVVITVTGLLIPSLAALRSNEPLRGTVVEFKALVRTTHKEAITQQKNMQLKFMEREIHLFAQDKPTQILYTLPLPKEVLYELRFWQEKEWLKGKEQLWTQTTAGLAEPLELRFRSKSSWVELTIDPLSATTSNESYYYE
ncbi:MAG: hypothetical protein AAF984_03440 [Verrucomicrobiota bacterium]